MESFVDELLEFNIIGQKFDESVGEGMRVEVDINSTGIENRDSRAGGEEDSGNDAVITFCAVVGAGEQMLNIELKLCVDFLSAMATILPCRLHGSSS